MKEAELLKILLYLWMRKMICITRTFDIISDKSLVNHQLLQEAAYGDIMLLEYLKRTDKYIVSP